MTASDKSTLNASRQERYLKAVELLSSAHSYTRLGAVHALVTLADEYLANHSLSEEEKHRGSANRRYSLRLYPRSF